MTGDDDTAGYLHRNPATRITLVFRQNISTVIARSPCDDAIQPACVSLDCFAHRARVRAIRWLAMTLRGW
jgi:hypothetical protein